MTTARTLSFAALGLVLFAASGCIPRQPTRTVRPTIDETPWTARTVRSETTGQEYQYLHLQGPDASAPKILLLHGGFIDERMWLNMDGLARRFEVFALEMPSDSPLYDGHIENYGDVAYDFLQALGISDLYVAGQSAGGWVAVDLVSRHRDLNVRALFLISTDMFASSEEEVERRTEMATKAVEMDPERLRATVQYGVGRADLQRASGPLQIDDIFYVRPYSYYRQLFEAVLNQGDRRQATDQITCPVLVIHGTGDETIPFEAAQATPSFFSDATLVPLEGYDHGMTFSHGPEVVATIMRFVDQRGLLTQEPAEEPVSPSDESTSPSSTPSDEPTSPSSTPAPEPTSS